VDSIDSPDPAASAAPPRLLRSAKRLPDIDARRCTGCGRCVAACELHLLSLDAVRWEKFARLHDPDRCTGCSACAVNCPFQAIAMRERVTAATFDGGVQVTTQPDER
jgi:ferredoxin